MAQGSASSKSRSQSLTQSITSTLRSADVSGSLISPHSGSEDDDLVNTRKESRPQKKPVCSCCKSYFDATSAIHPTNLKFNPIDPGYWDEWGIYYCSSRFGRHKKFNPNYFALAAIFVVGQSNFFDLIQCMQENGGGAFLVVLALTYISFGYLTYLLETMLGQYSGRKPIEMIRLMAPAFSGLGVALYIRTVFRAINILGTAANCLFHFWDLILCKGPQSALIRRIVQRERDQRTFIPFLGLNHPYLTLRTEEEFGLDIILIFLCSLFLLISFMKLKDYGEGMRVVLRLILLFLAGYSVSAYFRINPTIGRGHDPEPEAGHTSLAWDSLVYLPLKLAFNPTWSKLLDGKSWLRGITHVMRCLQLDTLIHLYLGSKVFFHYRCTRDGICLVLVAFTWNVIGVLGILLWMGYVGINEKEIRSSWLDMNGHYGMFVVFVMKHLQAEMTQEVESDVLFFCGIFYFITGLAALSGAVCYLYVLIDCAFPESGHPLSKMIVHIWYLFIFGVVLLPLMTSEDGVRHLIFLDHYGSDQWVGIFLILCLAFAVSWSQGIARVLHDFYNIIHLKGYKVMTHFHQIPSIVAVLFTGYPFIALLLQTIYREHLDSGSTDWKHIVSWLLGYYLTFSPVAAVVFGALFYVIQERQDTTVPLFQPHRDFYKNKHHIAVCFKDYEQFNPEKVPLAVRLKNFSFYTNKIP